MIREFRSEDIPTDRLLSLKGDYMILGDIPAGARLQVFGNLTIRGNVGEGAHIWSNGIVHTQNIAQEADVTGYSVTAHDIKKKARVTSTKGSLTVRHVSEGAVLTSGSDLSFNEADNCITAYAQDELNFDYTKDDCQLTAGRITGTGIGKHCQLRSTYGSIELMNVKGGCQLNSAASVEVEKNIGPNVLVHYQNYVKVPKNHAMKVRATPIIKTLGSGIEYNTETNTHMIPLTTITDPVHADLVYVIRDLERGGAKTEYHTVVRRSVPSQLDSMQTLFIRPHENTDAEQHSHISKLIQERLYNYLENLDAHINGNSVTR